MRPRNSRIAWRWVVAAPCVLACICATRDGQAREVDQFTDRLFQIQHLADASEVIDRAMNASLAGLVDALNDCKPATRQDRDRLVRDAFQSSRIDYFAQIVTPFESWLRDDAAVDLFWVTARGMYGGDIDYDDMTMGWYVELAPAIRVGSVVVGIDKLGHFLSQGWFYFQKEREIRAADPGASDAAVARRIRQYGHELEDSYLGLGGTGVYSYADLAANWQGLVFFRALFSNSNPYIAMDAKGRYRLARSFHIVDYVNDAWDEVINPSRPRSDRFFAKVARYLRVHACPQYRASRTAFLNESGRTQDSRDYVWEHADDSVFGCKRRFSIQDICQ